MPGGGLTQVGARYFDVALGRFISVDPVMNLLDPQQWNAYAYANNNPTTWSDPTGRIVRRDGDSPTAGSSLRAIAAPAATSKPRWQTEFCGYSFGCGSGGNPRTPISAGGGASAPGLPYVMKQSMDPEQVAINTAIARQMTDQAVRANAPGWAQWIYGTSNRWVEPATSLIVSVEGGLLAIPTARSVGNGVVAPKAMAARKHRQGRLHCQRKRGGHPDEPESLGCRLRGGWPTVDTHDLSRDAVHASGRVARTGHGAIGAGIVACVLHKRQRWSDQPVHGQAGPASSRPLHGRTA